MSTRAKLVVAVLVACGYLLAVLGAVFWVAVSGLEAPDQALLSVLPTRYATLRHYGLSSKVLIVDEVHEMGEAYLAEELKALLRAHRQAGGSVILLTATLPLGLRAALARAHSDAVLVGMRHGEDLAAHYASADLFLFPSVTETFGNVTLEAMASGTPVLLPAPGGASMTALRSCASVAAMRGSSGAIGSDCSVSGSFMARAR